jgi:hypothetical protein
MIPSAQWTLEQLKEFIDNENNTDKGAGEIQKEVEDSDDVLDPANTCSGLNTVSNTINDESEHECLNKAVRLLNAHPIGQSIDDSVAHQKSSIPGLSGSKFLANQVWAISYIVRR